MTALEDAQAANRPFSNGTEGQAWMDRWCSFCSKDHGMHDESGTPMCGILVEAMLGDSHPAEWVPEPDDGRFSLPSRMICTAFAPCTTGACEGDPGADERAQRVDEVTVYWRDRSAPTQKRRKGDQQ